MYPHKFLVTQRHSEFVVNYANLEEGQHVSEEVVSVAGRVLSKRGQGKLMFYDLHSEGFKIQIMSDVSSYEGGEEAFPPLAPFGTTEPPS